MTGKRIAIYGLGRSGLAIARAALALGAVPTVYDRALPEQMVKQDVLEAARELGIDLKLGWEGRCDPALLDLLVTNPGVDMRSPVLQQAKKDGIEILSEVEFAYRISKAPIVAITGTNGKSTTTVMTYLALRECGIDAVLCGNIFGTGLPEVPLTEAALNSTADQVLVAEISSFQLEWVSQFSPAVAGITNIAPDHLDRYDSFQQYADTKMRIFAALTAGDYAVVRAFDPVVRLGSSQPPTRRFRRGTAFQAVSLSGFQPEEQRLEASETHRLEGDATIEKRFGANLPHWTAEGAIYSVRFRLADSMPSSLVDQWNHEREEIATAVADGRLSPRQKFDAERLLALKVDQYLDAGHGACVLRQPNAAKIVRDALAHFEGSRYETFAWCVMPNHVHVLFRPLGDFSLEQTLHSWKSFTANQINKLLGQSGQLWQKESYNHLVRDAADFENHRAYILGNPEAARLKDWLWRGTAFQAVSLSGFQPEEQRLEASETHRLEGDATRQEPRGQSLEGPETHRLEGDATKGVTVYTFGAQGEHGQVHEEEIRILDRVIRIEEMQVIGAHNYANAAMAGLMSYATLRWIAEWRDASHDGVSPSVAYSGAERLGAAEGSAASIAATLLAEAVVKGAPKGKWTSTKRQKPFLFLPEAIVTALKAFKGIEHRMELLGSKNGVRIINNSMCTNPDAVVKSAQAVKGPNHLIMGGKDKDLPFAPVKNYLASGMHKAYLFGEAKEVLNEQLGGGFPTYNTLQEAFRAATEKARPGEVIMLAPGCASTDQFHDFRDRGNVFKKIAKEWLES